MKNSKLKISRDYTATEYIKNPANLNKKKLLLNKLTQKTSIQIKSFGQLKLSEIYNILKIRQDVFIVEMKIIYEDIDDRDSQCIHLWCQDDSSSNFLSYLRIMPQKEKRKVSIGRVLTVPAARGKGLCSEMMRKAISFIQLNFPGYLITLTAKEDLYSFYKAFGFEKSGQPFFYPENDPTPIYPMIYAPRHEEVSCLHNKVGKKRWA